MKALARLILTAALAALFLGAAGPARADCDQPAGLPDRNAYLREAGGTPAEALLRTLLQAHAGLEACLDQQAFVHYYCSASLVLARYGREFCRWSPSGRGGTRRDFFAREAQTIGWAALTPTMADRLRNLAGCLQPGDFQLLYADLMVLRHEYTAGLR